MEQGESFEYDITVGYNEEKLQLKEGILNSIINVMVKFDGQNIIGISIYF